MKGAKTKPTKIRGRRDVTCPRSMYTIRTKPEENQVKVSPFAKAAIETWVLFSSLYTVIGLFSLLFTN